jgi:hypothetical protein
MLADIDLRRACVRVDAWQTMFAARSSNAAVLEAGGYRMSVGTMPRGRRLSRGMILKTFACRVRYG